MASLKCNNCGYGIHYNDEPSGIEYTAISMKLWNMFSKTDKPILRYLLDGDDDYLIIWKCPECGCVHAFNGYSPMLAQAYIPCKQDFDVVSATKYIVFIDYLFEDISEKGLTADEFLSNSNYDSNRLCYALISNNGIVVYRDEECTDEERRYIAIPTEN